MTPIFSLKHKKKITMESFQVTSSKDMAQSDGTLALKSSDVRDMLSGMQNIRDRQDNTDNCLIALQQENAALWKEIAILRHKHAKQQEIVEKLINFLMTMVSNQGMGVKRKAQLMIDGCDNLVKRQLFSNESSNSGPIIQEVSNDDIEALAAEAPLDVSQTGLESILDSGDILAGLDIPTSVAPDTTSSVPLLFADSVSSTEPSLPISVIPTQPSSSIVQPADHESNSGFLDNFTK